MALLVERDGEHFVLKAASDPEQQPRLKDEAEVLAKETAPSRIVELRRNLEIGDRAAFLMRPVFADKDRKIIETLGQRLRKDGRLHVDLLQRFGEDLLDVLNYLEDQGIPHRDIKPDNIAVGMLGRGDKLHLVLFDFSLSRTPAENIRAGTTGYLDPLLPLRKPPRWDLHAERYAAAVTLYEMATGSLPEMGGRRDRALATQPADEITIEPELFDASLRERLAGFFRKAFRREHHRAVRQRRGDAASLAERFEGIERAGHVL